MSLLVQTALFIAEYAHRGVNDKCGVPYINHPVAVAKSVASHGEIAETVALLHDVIEDSDVEIADLRRVGIPEDVLTPLDAITQRKGEETYFEYIHRCKQDPVATIVKLADLDHNSLPERLVTEDLKKMAETRYVKARKILTGEIE